MCGLAYYNTCARSLDETTTNTYYRLDPAIVIFRRAFRLNIYLLAPVTLDEGYWSFTLQ